MNELWRETVIRLAGAPTGEMREVEDTNNHTFTKRFIIEAEIFDDLPAGTNLYTEAQLLDAAEALIVAVAEDMRERARRRCDALATLYTDDNVGFDRGYTMAAARAASEIAALPVSPPEGEKA